MIPSEAIFRFMDAQKRLLRQTYDQAWQRGVGAYQPDSDPAQNPTLPKEMATAGLSGAALLAARRRYKFVPPTHPDPVRRAVALAPAFGGVNDMGGELAALDAGLPAAIGDSAGALKQWAADNGWRLAAGAAVAWAGEQAGYAEAANVDGQYLYAWTSAGDERVCPDCEMLASFPPMPLDDWPTSPGAGDTTCSYGCRCDWDVWSPDSSNFTPPGLSGDQQSTADKLAAGQAETLNSMIGDAPYLD